jgi:hypothetical protein
MRRSCRGSPEPDEGDWSAKYAFTLRHVAELLAGDPSLDAVETMRRLADRAEGRTDLPIVGRAA